MAHVAFNAQDSAITPRRTFSSPTETNKLKKKSNSYHFYDRKHRQQHHQLQHRGRNSQPFTALTVLSTSLCTFLLNQRNRGEKWFLDKGHSLCEHPWVLLCLSKASADVKETDSSFLSRCFSAMALGICLLAAMVTAGDA